MARFLEEEEPDGDSTFWFGTWVTVVLIALSVFYDWLGEKVTSYLRRAAGQEEESEQTIRSHSALFLALWRRFNSELTTLGFLAFTTYIFAEAHFYEWLTDATKSRWVQGTEEGSGEESEGSERRRLGRMLIGRFLTSEEGEEGEEGESSDDCRRHLTSEGEWLEEHVECVHMAIFISMSIYFILVGIAIHVHGWRFNRAPKAGIEATSDSRYAARRMWLISQAQEWPAVKQLAESDPAFAKALLEQKFDYAGYIFIAGSGVVDTVVEFPATAWLVALLYSVLFAILSDGACAATHAIKFVVQVGTVVGFVYLSVRIAIFHFLIERGVNPWPMAGFDRIVICLLGPCCSGFVPWSAQPSRTLALSVQQAWLWFGLFRFAYAVSDEHGALYESGPHTALITDMAIIPAMSILLSFSIWPASIEMLALPPFANAENASDAFIEVLKSAVEGNEGPKLVIETVEMQARVRAPAAAPVEVQAHRDHDTDSITKV